MTVSKLTTFGLPLQINGQKKWITGGNMADYFTMLTKTENGLTVFLVPRHSQGLKVRVMPTQFDTSQGTTFLTMDDVKVVSIPHKSQWQWACEHES